MLTTITVRIAANVASVGQAFSQITAQATQFQSAFQGMTTAVAAAGEFLGNVFYGIYQSITRWFGGAIKDALKYSREFNNAIVGLTGVSRAFGLSSDEAMAAAKRLSANGLLPLRDSAVGLKNLLMTGFN